MLDNKQLEYQESTKYGALRELTAIKLFMEKEFTVSVPNMNVRYDFIAEKYPETIRVQVKNLKLKKGEIDDLSSHKTWCINSYSLINGKKRPYEPEDCDMIVGVCLETGDFAIVPIDKISGKTEFRLSAHKDSKGRDYLNSYKAIINVYESANTALDE